MKTRPAQPRISQSSRASTRMLNVGCGRRYHADWVNVDLVPMDDAVMACDISRGLPFPDEQFDVVYHSHVLEHLVPSDGEQLIAECFRVLRPGGVIRVAVPDLEQIARLYLTKHQHAWQHGGQDADYHWMKLELLDQMVRPFSGGEMGRYIVDHSKENADFVRSRIGHELGLCIHDKPETKEIRRSRKRNRGRLRLEKFRTRIARRAVRWIMGKNAVTAFDEGVFRQQGEIHRWMYDRYSLRKLFQSIGFESFQVRSAIDSFIGEFERFELDSVDGEVRKPDSIFVEALKPASVGIPELNHDSRKAA